MNYVMEEKNVDQYAHNVTSVARYSLGIWLRFLRDLIAY